MLLGLGLVPAGQAMEILRWERLPLAVPLMVGQERMVFIDRNVRVQSAGGAIYLRASKPIPPTRLQLQDVEAGALILLDIAAEPAKPGQAALEPVRIVEGEATPVHYGEQAGASPHTDDDEKRDTPRQAPHLPPRRETPVAVILTRYAAQNLYAPLRTVGPVAGIGRVNLRRDLPLDTLLPTLPVRARALAAWRLEDQWVTAVRLTNTTARWLDLDPRALRKCSVQRISWRLPHACPSCCRNARLAIRLIESCASFQPRCVIPCNIQSILLAYRFSDGRQSALLAAISAVQSSGGLPRPSIFSNTA